MSPMLDARKLSDAKLNSGLGGYCKENELIGGVVAEWSKVLLLRKKISKNQKDPRFAPGLGKLVKIGN